MNGRFLIVALVVPALVLFNSRIAFSADDTDKEKAIVASFKKVASEHIKSYEKENRERLALLGGGWVKEKYEAQDKYEIDVEATKSLISPYIGTFEFSLKAKITNFHSTKEDAQKDNNFVKSTFLKHKHTYAYQDDKWVVKSRKHYDDFFHKWNDCDEVIKGGPEKGTTNIFGCFEIEEKPKSDDKPATPK